MDTEPIVINYFKQLGFTAEKILEGSEKTPDFFVYDEKSSFLVELKTKFPSDSEIAERNFSLDRGQIHNIQEQLIRKNTLSGITHDAARQLRKYGAENLFRVVFLLTTGHIAEPRFVQFQASLYGLTTIADFSEGIARECYFFYDSDFYRNRDSLDAAIVSTERERSLLLNPYSPRFNLLQNFSLCDRFDGVIVNPVKREMDGQAYYVDGNVNRQNEDEVLAFVKQKYGKQNLVKVDMSFLSGTMQYLTESE